MSDALNPLQVPVGVPFAAQGAVPFIGVPNSQDTPRLVFTAPYFHEVPLAELIAPTVTEAVEAQLPALVPPYVNQAAIDAVNSMAVKLIGSTMTGPLYLSPLMPTQPSQAASKAYVDSLIATAGVPEVPPVPAGQTWARQTGQWVAISTQTGVFLPLAGGVMQGQINMSGNAITNLPALPVMPNGAAPATWVLNQIAAQSLYQGTWNIDTYTPDLTNPATHQNDFSWVAVTTNAAGIVIAPPIPGLQGQTVFNGDTVIYSAINGVFQRIHAGGLSLAQADARYLQLGGGQMSGALLLSANATQPTQAVTLQQMQAFVPPGSIGEAPNTGMLYGRNGATTAWAPVLPLAGGVMTGLVTLSGNAAANLNPVPLQQMNSAISASAATLLPIAGGTLTGPLVLVGNATANLQPVTLQQMNSVLAGGYLPLGGGTISGTPGTLSVGSTTLPGDAAVGSILSGGNVSTVAGAFAANAYFTGSAWKQLTVGQVSVFAPNGSGGFTWYGTGSSAAAGATVTLTTTMQLTAAGNLQTVGGIAAGNVAVPANSFASQVFATSHVGSIAAGGDFTCNLMLNAAGTNWIYVGNGIGGIFQANTSGGFGWFTAGSGTAGATATVTQTMSLTSGGTLRPLYGHGCQAGIPPGGTQVNVFNIEWPGSAAHLWIDNVNQGAFAFTSDYRTKKDIEPLPSTWERTKALRPIRYTQREYHPSIAPREKDAGPMFPADDNERWGFVAHELQETLIPSAANGTKDQENCIQSPNPWTVLATLTRAVQEAMTRIEALETTH